jgi:hypothetical protein
LSKEKNKSIFNFVVVYFIFLSKEKIKLVLGFFHDVLLLRALGKKNKVICSTTNPWAFYFTLKVFKLGWHCLVDYMFKVKPFERG